MKIFINAGPCIGKDSGAIGFGLTEAHKTFAIGQRLDKILQSFGFETKFLQSDSLREICDVSNSWKSDLFVSIHCNAANKIAQGTEIYCYRGSTAGRKFATAVHNSIVKTFPELLNRGVKQEGFYVLRHTSCPAILVETAFIDNLHDNKILVEREFDFANAMSYGICNFVGITPDVIDR